MEIFINECSLHEQFYDKQDFKSSIKVFLSIFNLINEKKIENEVFQEKSLLLYGSNAIKNEIFLSSLKSLADKSLSNAVKNILFNKLNIKDWKDSQKHSPDDWFTYDDDIVTETSMAELAERKIQNEDLRGLLVNFQKSKFMGFSTIPIEKNDEQEIELDCIENKKLLEEWLEENFNLTAFEYDYSFDRVPTDKQTILKDKSRFKAASKPLQGGRKVFLEVSTKYYWYVDSLHKGKGAHLEVFDNNGNHIGEADLDGNISFEKNDPEKKI